MKLTLLPDGYKIKQVMICRGADDRPFFGFLSEGGSFYVACDQGWSPLEKLNQIKFPEVEKPPATHRPSSGERLTSEED